MLHFFLNRAFAILFFSISNDLLQLLISWEKQQRYELVKFVIISNP
ncbi:conserved domain protein [Streptococcus mitis SK1080]|uniref:Conserved domain protein n=1 Tax=Streptococcus mitis SK1080 TaxID=1008453 RepID=F9HN48_STRMT|nr:conserved domain protein [Streptococcus mitis SK1080]